MRDALRLLPVIVRNWLRARAQLQHEILALRHQLSVLQRGQDRRPRFTSFDRIFWVWLYRLWPGCLDALAIMKPETVVRWHRKGYRKYWTWKSRVREPGRPAVSLEIRSLVRRMSQENPLWGAPRIHGELLKLGIGISQASVSKYMVRHPRPPSLPRHAVPRLNHRFNDGCMTFGQSHGPLAIHISAIEDWADPEFGPG